MMERAEQLDSQFRGIQCITIGDSESNPWNRLPMERIVVGVLRYGKTRRREAHTRYLSRSQISR